MLDPIQIIKRPLVTEKTSWESDTRNRYAFEVPMQVRKVDVKRAVESLYGVRVVKVATQVRKGKEKRTRHGLTKTPDWKRATVQLHEEDRIELF